jgi:hypothetical protein
VFFTSTLGMDRTFYRLPMGALRVSESLMFIYYSVQCSGHCLIVLLELPIFRSFVCIIRRILFNEHSKVLISVFVYMCVYMCVSPFITQVCVI